MRAASVAWSSARSFRPSMTLHAPERAATVRSARPSRVAQPDDSIEDDERSVRRPAPLAPVATRCHKHNIAFLFFFDLRSTKVECRNPQVENMHRSHIPPGGSTTPGPGANEGTTSGMVRAPTSKAKLARSPRASSLTSNHVPPRDPARLPDPPTYTDSKEGGHRPYIGPAILGIAIGRPCYWLLSLACGFVPPSVLTQPTMASALSGTRTRPTSSLTSPREWLWHCVLRIGTARTRHSLTKIAPRPHVRLPPASILTAPRRGSS